MAWIESHIDLEDHPKRKRVGFLMGWDKFTTIGRLHCLWWWCLKYAEDGDLTRFNDIELGEPVGLSGNDCKKFVDAMVDARFLEREPFFRIHDWMERVKGYLVSKYHTSNPKKLKSIVGKYGVKIGKRVGSPKGAPKGVPKGDPPNLTLPNLSSPNLPGPNQSLSLGSNNGPALGSSDDLIREIIDYCKDPSFRPLYIKTIRSMGEGILREEFGELKDRIRRGVPVTNRSHYFAAMLTNRANNVEPAR